MNIIKYINISLEVFGCLLSLIIILSLLLTGQKKNALNRSFIRIQICNMLVLFFDAAAWYFKGNPDAFSYYAVRIANFCVFTCGYLLLALFTSYLVEYIAQKTAIPRTPARFLWLMCAVSIFLVIISQFNHMYYSIDDNNIYQRQDWFWLSQALPIVCMCVNASIIFEYRKHLSLVEKISFASHILLPVAAMTIQIFIYGVALLYLATSISSLCIYMGIQVEQARKFRQKELELERKRTEILLSQIQPHFLFNSLNSICYLCRTDPEQAEKVVVDFSDFLRGNLNSLNSMNPIPFSAELDHLKHYLDIEKVRYGEKLAIEYDIKANHFTLPSLTIQPLVENAVRYGVGKKEGGGTVRIATEEYETNFVVTISDNGVGFDPQCEPKDGLPHIGIQNVRQRIFELCGGSLQIESSLGTGTIVTLTIPKEVVTPELHGSH